MAAAALIYIVNKRRANAPHRISRAVLMSPAGYHHRIPRGCRYLGPWIDWLAKRSGVYSLSVPSEMARNLSRKLMQGKCVRESARGSMREREQRVSQAHARREREGA